MLKINEIRPDFGALVEENDGYCPCALDKNADSLCPCREFRERETPGVCHCGRYEKVEANK